MFLNKFNFNNCIGYKTLLYGEINTKKTYYTAKFIQFLVETKNFEPNNISILDFAPPLHIIKDMKVGGKVKDYYNGSIKCNNLYFKGEIIPPRLKSRNVKELYNIACDNYKKTYEILYLFKENPTPVLIINDISIYLHIGNRKLLLDSIRKVNTFFGNSYYGSSMKSDFTKFFNLREKRLVENLIKKIEFSYFTG